jgi:hypothetical protein
MAEYAEVSEPILNSPFEKPTRYWYIREGERPELRPSSPEQPTRRPALIFPPKAFIARAISSPARLTLLLTQGNVLVTNWVCAQENMGPRIGGDEKKKRWPGPVMVKVLELPVRHLLAFPSDRAHFCDG